MWGIIATWRMSLEGIIKAEENLRNNGSSIEALEIAIKEVEDFPYYKSVGYGGLPNEDMVVELDAAFMDGDTLSIGAIGSIRDFKNPVSIARSLLQYKNNNFLVGTGAEKYAHKHGFERKNMLSDRAIIHYKNRIFEDNNIIKKNSDDLKPYQGHDTVGMVSLDSENKLAAATSTSGLFMKKSGRVGDSPVIGSGLYADSDICGVTATGLGEDIMKGCISFEITKLVEQGMNIQDACDKAVFELEEKLIKKRGQAGDISVVAMDKNGNFAASSNINDFSFVVATENIPATVYIVKRNKNKCTHEKASSEWLDNYMKKRMSKLEKKYEE